MKSPFSILFLFFAFNSFAQGEAANWFFGNRAGIKFNADNTITVLSTPPNPIGINTSEGCSSLSDSNGNLILYTDGRTVWDRNHVIMPNGNYDAGTGLYGDPSSTQSGIIVPKPSDPNIYYIFTVDEPHHQNAAVYPNQFTGQYDGAGGSVPLADDGLNNGLNYSIVDISITGSNGSIGDVISRNTHLQTYDPNPASQEIRYKCSEKITAVKSATSGYWVITHFTDKFYAFKVDASGIGPNPVITQINPLVPVSGYRRNSIGQIKASPNGRKIAVAHNQLGTQTGGSTSNGVVYLYDFDNVTGIISNGVQVMQNVNPYGIEFSAETKKLYTSVENGVWQFNLESAAIASSGIMVSTKSYSSLQLGPDKKIYKANINNNDTNFLDVINNPELEGLACGYQNAAVNLGVGFSLFGLPPFITSVFDTAISAKNLCLGDTTIFELNSNGTVESAIWDFGDGSPTTTTIEPTHIFPAPGDYNVTVMTIVEGIPLNNSKIITISPLPDAFPSSLTQCSPTTAETNILFNLSQANPSLTNGNSNLSTSFYRNENDAIAGTGELANQYSNISNPQQLFVRVIDNATECYSITTLDLIVNASSNAPFIIEKCDSDGIEDGFSQFDLTQVSLPAGLPATATLSYFPTIDNAFLEQNSISPQFTNTTENAQTVYIRVEDNNECLGFFAVNLIVNPLPQIEIAHTDYICTNLPNRYTTLNAGLLQGNPTSYDYEWSTGAITPTIQVNTAGIYTVKVINQFGCEKMRTVTVLPSNNATIEEVVIVDLVPNNSVTVLLDNQSLGNYVYSLDAPNGPFQESNYFENVTPGFHTVYVLDTLADCGITLENISVLSIPKYFTPNNDGVNDTWDIVGVNSLFFANSKIYIFDRLGKLLASVDPKGTGWNGIYNDRPLPSTDYWYVVVLDNGRTVKGHFSLIR